MSRAPYDSELALLVRMLGPGAPRTLSSSERHLAGHMCRRGLVIPNPRDALLGKRRTRYTLTAEGRALARAHASSQKQDNPNQKD